MRVRYHDVRQPLHVSKAVSQPGRKLETHIVRRAQQSAFGECATKEEELSQTDRTNWTFVPSGFKLAVFDAEEAQ